MRKKDNTKIPIVFEQEKVSTKSKLANLLKKYNACMTYNPNENIYEVDVQVKFNSIGEKMDFMQNYLKKERVDKVLEEQPHNSQKNLHHVNQKSLINLSSIKKNQQLEYSISHIEDSQLKKVDRQYQGSKLFDQSQENINGTNYEQLSIRLQQAIDKSCQQILLSKLRPNRPKQKSKEIFIIQNDSPKRIKKQVHFQQSAFSSKSKDQIIKDINKDLYRSNREHQEIKMQINPLLTQGSSLFSQQSQTDNVGASCKYSDNQSNTSKSNQLSNNLTNYNNKHSNYKQSNEFLFPKQVPKQKPTTQSTKSGSIKMTKQQFNLFHKQTSSKSNNIANDPKLRFQKILKQQSKKVTPSYQQSSRSTTFTKTNKQQHQQFKKFLKNHRQKLDTIVQSYDKNSQQIYIQQSSFQSYNTNKDFNNRIIQEYRQKIVATNQNMSSAQMIGYFRFLIKHAKGLYVDFLKR